MVKNTCKLHQSRTKCWSIMLNLPEYKVTHTKSDLTGFKITSDITVLIIWQYWLQMAPNSLLWGCVKIYLNLAK